MATRSDARLTFGPDLELGQLSTDGGERGGESVFSKSPGLLTTDYYTTAATRPEVYQLYGSTDEVEYRVIVFIYEARNLEGVVLEKNPSVKVKCRLGSKVKKTKGKKGSNSPKFEQQLSFNFKCVESELLEKSLHVKVYTRVGVMRHQQEVGIYKMSLRHIYKEPKHLIAYKWMVLTSSSYSSEVKGYLKVSIQIIGPDDVPEDLSKRGLHYAQDSDEIADRNLLKPRDVNLVPSVLVVRVYEGHDFPQMDPKNVFRSKQKQYVDPYCVIPPLSDRIQFQVMDDDSMTDDDYIGAVFFHLSHISEPGLNGFPPTFGPCFINLYGSTREFEGEFKGQKDEYQNLNKGLVKGVAYRGRILVEILSKPASSSIPSKLMINDSEVKRGLRHVASPSVPYKLVGIFFSANMIHPANKLVEFELSIGSHGYLLTNESHSSYWSRTPPLRPLKHSMKKSNSTNYYMPWLDQKPSIEIESTWEDCSQRIQAFNLLLRISEKFDKKLGVVRDLLTKLSQQPTKLEMREKEGEEGRERSEEREGSPCSLQQKTADKLLALLETLEKDLDFDLPIPDHPNALDLQLNSLRVSEFGLIKEGIFKLRKEVVDSKRMEKKQRDILKDGIEELEGYRSRIKSLCAEPQNSVPDVILWMIVGNERKAVKRFSSHEIMYAHPDKYKGKYCGKIQIVTLEAPGELDETIDTSMSELKVGAQVELFLWLGLKEDYEKKETLVTEQFSSAKLSSYGEVYEYQSSRGSSKSTWMCSRGGELKGPLEKLIPPAGWKWKDNAFWLPSSLVPDEEEATEFTEVLFEYHLIQSEDAEETKEAEYFWENEFGEEVDLGEVKESKLPNVRCHDGWEWSGAWTVRVDSFTDPEGWLFSKERDPSSTWVKQKRAYHKYQRRAHTRLMKKRDIQRHVKDLWEYGSTMNHQKAFTATKKTTDLARRRRWTKEVEYVEESKVHAKKKSKQKHEVPIQDYLHFKESLTFQLRAYLYQARDLYSGDARSLSDPYAEVNFGCYSGTSEVIKNVLNPVWNQTVLINNVRLYGDADFIKHYTKMKCIFVVIWDKDTLGHDYLGEARGKPVIQWGMQSLTPHPHEDPSDQQPHPPVHPGLKLQWLPIKRLGEHVGDILAAFELVPSERAEFRGPTSGAKGKEHFQVPLAVAPVMKMHTIEFRCWGLRNMKKLFHSRVSSPYVELQVGGTTFKVASISHATRNSNFEEELTSHDVNLPSELDLPAVTIMVYDKRLIPRKPLVGSHVIKYPWVVKSSELHRKEHLDEITPRRLRQLEKVPRPDEEEKIYDWWSKYYSSFPGNNEAIERKIQTGYSKDKLKIYEDDLESSFNDFSDFLTPFYLHRGKGSHDDPDDRVGCLKGALRMYETPDFPREGSIVLNQFPSNRKVDILVRVYVVEGINLSPQDLNGSSDPYLKISLGKNNTQDTSDSSIKNDLNPIFGTMKEFKGSLPQDHTLTVTVMDDDFGNRDDLIGSTIIDLENRFYTQHRARCGLPATLSMYGVNCWRDSQSPEEILQDWAKTHGLSLTNPDPNSEESKRDPQFKIGSREFSETFRLSNFENLTGEIKKGDKRLIAPKESLCADPRQRLALHILRKKQMKLRRKGFAADLVPEHVETRLLYHPMHPKMAQGQLRMWVDIFDRTQDIPPPVNITARIPEEYELRVIVWNVMDVPLDEVSIVTKEKMSDIYVKGWLVDESKSQKTDVHYRSMDGVGNFNWRLVFPFQYIEAENSIIVEKKEHAYHLHKTKSSHYPVLTLEIWDDDKFTLDDFLGRAEFNLSEMPLPLSRKKGSQEKPDATKPSTCNLFVSRRIKGWWSETLPNPKSKLELELEILTRDEALDKPAGKGREDPNMNPYLHKPKRPDTSFFWLFSPIRTCKHIVWKYHKWEIIGLVLLIMLILIIVALVYTIPSQVIRASIDKMLPF